MTLEEVYNLAKERKEKGEYLTESEILTFADEVYRVMKTACRSQRLGVEEAKRRFIEKMRKEHKV